MPNRGWRCPASPVLLVVPLVMELAVRRDRGAAGCPRNSEIRALALPWLHRQPEDEQEGRGQRREAGPGGDLQGLGGELGVELGEEDRAEDRDAERGRELLDGLEHAGGGADLVH